MGEHDSEGVGKDGDGDGKLAEPFAVGLEVGLAAGEGLAVEAGCVGEGEEWVQAMEVGPAREEPHRQRENSGGGEDEKAEVLVMNRGLPWGETAEEATEVTDTHGHDADGGTGLEMV